MGPPTSNRETTYDQDGRKRVPKACDRCRLKKVKCDGNMPCPRCKMDDAVCHFGARRKSIERPISAGYVDQLELQQNILIKALRETWRVYGPTNVQANGDISIHDIVESLGVLKDAPGYQPISPDFMFNERLAGPTPLSVNTELTPPFSDDSPASSSEDSVVDSASPMETEGRFFSASKTFPDSRLQSTKSSPNSVRAPSPPTSNFAPINKIKPHSHNNSKSSTRLRPTFCPLPPRPQYIPTVPTPMARPAFSGFGAPSDVWALPDGSWVGQAADMNAMAPNFDQGLAGLMQTGEESWSGWGNVNERHDGQNNRIFNGTTTGGVTRYATPPPRKQTWV